MGTTRTNTMFGSWEMISTLKTYIVGSYTIHDNNSMVCYCFFLFFRAKSSALRDVSCNRSSIHIKAPK